MSSGFSGFSRNVKKDDLYIEWDLEDFLRLVRGRLSRVKLPLALHRVKLPPSFAISMLTPHFELSQDEDFVYVRIRSR